MKFGICTDFTNAERASEFGFDYIEGNVSVIAAMSDEEFSALAEKNAASPIKMETCCILFPGSVKLCGPEADAVKIAEYLDGAFGRLAQLGVQTVVFGSGGARRVPDGFDRAEAYHQLIIHSRLIAEKAERCGIRIALEPLMRKSCNIINNTASEGLGLVEDVDRPAFGILVDTCHLHDAGEASREIALCGSRLLHAHINNPDGIVVPREGDGADYGDFFAGLAAAGYDGRVSIEANVRDFDEEMPAALALLKKITAKR